MEYIKPRQSLDLPIDNGHVYVINDDLKKQKEELEKFLDGIHYMNSRDFSKKVLFGAEIKANNSIEGYLDDITEIRDIIKHPSNNLNEEQRTRVLNLYRGYKYILQGESINKDTLKSLYNILSQGLLSQDDINAMGEYYRLEKEYIFYSSIVSVEPDVAVDPSEVNEKMEILLDYINDKNDIACMTDYFIKSQIAHFYFVYIHPYYDINGRTARTTSMWYLLNNKAYPYIIFNRAIQLNKNKYYVVIRDVKKYHNVTYFLNYLLKNVLTELEKEYTMQIISESANYELTSSDIQSIYYILSMNSHLSYADFAAYYNHLNDSKKVSHIYDLMLESLIDKEIIIPGRVTKEGKNRMFSLNPSLIEIDDKNKHLNLTTKIM
jgi:Fic family protein